ncbi:MAG: thioredoxin domain-containing protein [Nanoarchaeota archaeon]|nr:thioredoxin domain-containing protein [Nanoarchaeota archaeon]
MAEEKTETTKPGTITIRKDALWKYSTFALVGILVLGVIFFVLPDKSPTGAVIGAPSQQPNAPPTQQIQIDLSELEDAPSLGDPDAPVVMLEFSDYACPFCNKHHQQTQPLLDQNYIDNGQLRIIFLNFISVGSAEISSAPKCARELGGDDAFWKYHDALYDTIHIQKERPPSVASFERMAVESGVDGNAFMTCLNSGKYIQEVNSETALGRSLGVTGTPGFLVGNEANGFSLLSGAQPFSAFKAIIDAELAA